MSVDPALVNLFDFEAAAKLSGARFVVLKKGLARLERAVVVFRAHQHERNAGRLERVQVEQHVDAVKTALAPWDAGRRYLNFTESAFDTRRAYSERAYRRLQAVKTLVDPDDVFRANHPIEPIR